MTMAMRDEIREAIKAGGDTKESLLALTGTTEKGLASQFTYLRMMGTCPKKKEDGTWEIVSTEEWESHRSSGSGPAASLTPEQRADRAEKRSKRAAGAFDNAKARFDANKDDRLTELKFVKAQAELEIAEIELGRAETAFIAASDAAEENPEPTDNEDDTNADGMEEEEGEELE